MKDAIKFLCLSLFLFLLFTACDKEKNNDLIGTWKLSEFLLHCPEDGFDNYSQAAEGGCIEIEDETICLTIHFETETEGRLLFGEDNNSSSFTPFTYSSDEKMTTISLCFDGNDCAQVILEDEKLILEESDPECPARYILKKSN